MFSFEAKVGQPEKKTVFLGHFRVIIFAMHVKMYVIFVLTCCKDKMSHTFFKSWTSCQR